MIAQETLAFRLDTIHGWVRDHAKKSEKPSLFLDVYEEKLKQAKKLHSPELIRIDYSDPVRLAAEIEAWAAVRRAEQWFTRDGLCKVRKR